MLTDKDLQKLRLLIKIEIDNSLKPVHSRLDDMDLRMSHLTNEFIEFRQEMTGLYLNNVEEIENLKN